MAPGVSKQPRLFYNAANDSWQCPLWGHIHANAKSNARWEHILQNDGKPGWLLDGRSKVLVGQVVPMPLQEEAADGQQGCQGSRSTAEGKHVGR